MSTPPDARRFQRLLDEDEEAGVGAVETAEKLFAELSERLSQRKRPAGAPEAVLQFKVADAAWIIDLRRGASELVRRGTVPAPDVTVTVPNEQDLLELLRRRLSPFRALATKRLQFRGDLKVLRSLEWVWRARESGSADASPLGGVRVVVVGAEAVADAYGDAHGEYRLRVEEGAARWEVRRRWTDLKLLTSTLRAAYGHSAFGIKLPSLPRSLLTSSATSATLARRRVVIEEHLRALLAVLPCSPRTLTGPPPLLAFLDGPALATAADADADFAAAFEKAAPPEGSWEWVEAAAAAAAGAATVGGVEMRELQLRTDLEAADAALLRLRRKGAAARAALGAAALLAAAASAAVALAAETWVATALAALAAAAAAVALAMLAAAARPASDGATSAAASGVNNREYDDTGVKTKERGLRLKLALLKRYSQIFFLFWGVIYQYRWARARAKRLADKSEDGEDDEEVVALWEATHERVGALLFRQIQALGGLWLKMGQFIAARSDVTPAPIGRHLALLLDANPPRPLGDVLLTLKEELGEGYAGSGGAATALVRLEPAPLSVASIAQVHVGWLANGQKVAVKVSTATSPS